MVCETIRQASALPLAMGVTAVIAVMGCETAKPGETPRLIMEQGDETVVPTGQSAESGPSGQPTPHDVDIAVHPERRRTR